ncbi:hypothetical protein COV82_04930 [Candidatus Peregrinibacteria bacterium CG11_big_fil_rev_8_21_14_0_20_46_8]|nr:MAG: hypothetical protein COV82_04930 [Candidatus Peregrinibacteria bacterium CG11_big_fil_rev_8_21_14_0_20_46_8]
MPAVHNDILKAPASRASISETEQHLADLTDSELYKKCQNYGLNARTWARKFAGLLPEVQRRQLYKKKGFHSIYEFAKQLGGLSEASINKVLNLGENFKDKPALKSLLENGKVGWSKLEKIASIASTINDANLAQKSLQLSTRALEIYVQQIKKTSHVSNAKNNSIIWQDCNQNGHSDKNLAPTYAPNHPLNWNNLSFKLHPHIERKMRLIKQQLEQECKQPLSWNEVMAKFAEQFESKQSNGHTKQTEHKQIVETCKNCTQQEEDTKETHNITTRYIPAVVHAIINARSGGTCEFSNCNKPATIYHHTRRFALRKNHDPNFIVALCTGHERFVQAGFIENEENLPSNWRVLSEPDPTHKKYKIDRRVAELRSAPLYYNP